jgi:DNA-binding CsgD family transcriptional regulator
VVIDVGASRRRHAASVASFNASPDGPDAVQYALALLDLGNRQWCRALARLDTLSSPSLVLASLPDRVEAAVRLGRHEEALVAEELLGERAVRSGSTWLRARAACATGLLSTGADAVRSYERGLTLAGDRFPFERARARLLLGEHLRRSRRRADARVALRAALAGFEEAHAEAWAERARAELRASGETARRRDPGAVDQLTPQQLQIVRVVAEGLSNKEVAQRLFVSPRTVDNHLRNAFAKLGVTSRTQLVRHVLREAAS